jgi:hypothetical protein
VRYGIFVNRGMAFFLQKDLTGAERELRRATALNPDQYPAFASLGGLYVDQAASLKDAKRQRKLAQAQECLDRALELKPLAAQYRTRARLYLLREEHAEALADLRQAIAHNDGGAGSKALAEDHVECGRILFRDKKFDRPAMNSRPRSRPTRIPTRSRKPTDSRRRRFSKWDISPKRSLNSIAISRRGSRCEGVA